ncbi:glycerol dehydratase reactivase beta/small subunit family protein [Brevibacillus sp. TJ4]|uniref:glycerol dehydratase reactivase beta/small subunit family protein n=1 Tax=Brevibacillus sp. TJ4 TaxID=3234853 RepID=UPI0037D886B3
MRRQDIAIPVVYEDGVAASSIRQICAGLEEEAVPFRLHRLSNTAGQQLPEAVIAQMSALQVGIGVERNGCLSLYHEKLGRQPYLQDSQQHARRIGKNAARLVKGLPLHIE